MPKKPKLPKPVFGKEFPVIQQIYRDSTGGWRWRLYGRNREVLAVSSESYTRRTDARRAWGLVKDGVKKL